ncbi:MAG TPA: GNAT family N-acetyltransferase [Thermoplasmata archaeon]|jgi:ribosomal protein S18 acetylase RimI-like enzyme|nr:GNAT family N-acetyltransferase [Thermoplasmata archaeon]
MSGDGGAGSRASGPKDATSVPIHLRPARDQDLAALLPLLLRLKRLNEEFDPLLRVREDAEQQARQILKADITNPKAVVLAAEGVGADRDKVVGFVRAHVRERAFYAPEFEGVILDIYLLPLYRRRGVGEFVLEEVSKALKAKGAAIVTAEFPAQNEIASRFYSKRGFRPIIAVQARSL